jgi:hypothetical protein
MEVDWLEKSTKQGVAATLESASGLTLQYQVIVRSSTPIEIESLHLDIARAIILYLFHNLVAVLSCTMELVLGDAPPPVQ